MTKEDDYLLTNQEILGGIKSAIARGENLKDAMMTFYQAGYDKEEIEEAARAYLNQGDQPTQPQMDVSQRIPQKPTEPAKKPEKKKELAIPVKKPMPKIADKKKEMPKNPQKVSNYLPPKKVNPEGGRGLTIALTVVLLFLLGILVAVFLFKDELVTFFNGLFG